MDTCRENDRCTQAYAQIMAWYESGIVYRDSDFWVPLTGSVATVAICDAFLYHLLPMRT